MQTEIFQGFPLSPQQHVLWLLQRRELGTCFRVEGEIHLLGHLDSGVLRSAWQRLLVRHEILRTSFHKRVEIAVPLQVVAEVGGWSETEHDLSGLSAVEQERRLAALRDELVQKPFDLTHGPMLRMILARLAQQHHALLVSLPALCADRAALDNLVSELADAYAAALTGREMEGAPLQYADFSQWQTEILEAERDTRDGVFWLAKSLPRLLPLRLVPESGGGAAEGFMPAVVTRMLPAERERALAELVSRHAATPAAFFLLCWQVLLARLSREPEILIGLTCQGRDYEELQGAVGLFAREVPVLLAFREDQSVAEAVIRAQRLLQEAETHQESFHWGLIEGTEVHGGELPPWFSYAFESQAPLAPERQAGDLALRLARASAWTSRFKLKLAVVPVGTGMELALHYDRSMFSAAAASRLLEQLTTLAVSAVERPEALLGDLEILGGAERHRILFELNDTGLALLSHLPLHHHVAAQIGRDPERIAVVAEGRKLTCRELDRLSDRLARHLRARGVRPESVVALYLERSLEMVVAVLGVLKAGGAFLPLEPGLPPARLALMLEDARATVVLVQERLAADLPFAGHRLLAIEPLLAEPAEDTGPPFESGATSDSLAYVIYTSGSTGRPKAVAVSHRAILNRLLWMQEAFPIGPDDRVLLKTPLSFDASIWELFLPLLQGALLVVTRHDGQRDAAYLVRTVDEQRVTILQLVPSLLRVFLDEEGVGRCTSLRRVFCGGEALPGALAEKLTEILPAELCNLYGPTETAIDATYCEYRSRPDGATVPIGRPIANARVYLLDRHLRPVASGTAGELYIGGAGLARGYLGQAERTAERFVPDPFAESGGRLYRTGDLARLSPEGTLEFLGRTDHQVKLRGLRIELGEIEHELSAHAGVREAVVVLQGGAEESQRLVAYVTHPAAAPIPQAAELARHLRERLPEHMVPAVFVTLPALPLLPNGKVDRQALPAPSSPRTERRTPPRNADEQLLLEIWRELLRIDELGIDDNFFQFGGDSILAIQVVARTRQAGFEVHARQLFENQTVAALAGVLRRTGDTARPRRQRPAPGPLPLTPIQRYFFEQKLPDPDHYNQSVLLQLRPSLTTARLAAALAQVASHHDSLRLRFLRQGDEWQQILIAEPEVVPVTEIDLGALAGPSQHTALVAVKEAAQASLDLGHGPLLRAVLLTQGAVRQLLIVAHHLVIDGVSWRVLLEDLAAACARPAGSGEPPELPEAVSFAEWCLAAERLARSGALAPQREHWLGAVAPQVAPLPLDGHGANLVGTAARTTITFDTTETSDLLRRIPAVYRTQIDDVLLAALLRTVASWTGEPCLLIDLEGHGREEIEPGLDLSRTVGWLTCVYPVLLELPDDPGPGETIKAVKEQLRAVPRRGVGYGLLRYLGDAESAASLAGQPQAQMIWNYLGQLDQSVADSSPFAPAPESPGSLQGPRQPRRYLLEVLAAVVEGRLKVTWTYSREIHHPKTVERLAQGFRQHLSLLIAHCLTPEAGGYTPSDFPLATIDQESLDRLVAAVGRGLEDLYPLSPVQEGLLFHTVREPGSGVYFQQLSCALHGALDPAALAAAWQQAGERHPVLRTSFVWQGLGRSVDRPLQIVHAGCDLPFTIHDWRGLSAAVQEAALHEFEAADRRRGFDLFQPPLSRLALIRLSEEAWQLVWSHHHLILDGWSVPLLIGEVFATYEALRRGAEPEPVDRPPYRELIAWLERQSRAEAETYWRDALGGFTAPTPLPADRPDMVRSSSPGEHRLASRRLGTEATAVLREHARRERVTLNTLVQAAWALLLGRYAGSSEVVFGGVTSGRPAEIPGVERMLGAFINTVPVRVEIAGSRPVGEWLRGLQEQQAELRRFDYASLVQIQGWSEVGRGASLFDSLLVFENYPVDEELRRLDSGLDFGPVRFHEQTHYPLVLAAAPAEALPVQVDYATAAFDSVTIERLLGVLETLLIGLASRAEEPVATVPLLRQAELHQLLLEWNDSVEVLGPDRCLHELFEDRVAVSSGAVALRFPGGVLSYSELDGRANRLAHRLRHLGVAPESVVALCLERSPELVVAILAVFKAGGCYLPLDPSYPPERLELLCADARPRVLLTRSDLLPRIAGIVVPAVLCLDIEDAVAASGEALDAPPLASPENLAYVIYTSGSTGRPKGVMVSHRAIANRVLWTNHEYPLTSSDRLLQKTPASFDASIWEIFAPLLAGAELVLAEPEGHRDPVYLGRAVREQGITALQLVPSMLRAFAELPELESCTSLVRLFSGGEALPNTLAASVSARLGAEVINLYGPTETAIDASSFRWVQGMASGALVPIGRPLANLRLYVLAPWFLPLPPGAAGRLYVGGPSLARGYLGRPDLTAERFVPDPWAGAVGERLYDTGDLVRFRADGALDFLGRADDQVKVRGFRIELGEIEAVLEEHDAVRQAAAVVRGAQQDLVGYVVPSGEPPSVAELRTFLRGKLPAHMVPSSLMIVSELPRTSSGKLDRRALPAPEQLVAGEGGGPARRLRSSTEELVSTLWEDLLGVTGMSTEQSFFELGGHSLLAMQLVSRLRDTCGVEIPIAKIFAHPTASELAAIVDEELAADRRSPLPPLVQVPRDQPLPLSFAQQRLWFMEQLEPGSVAYNILLFLRFTGTLDRGALTACLEQIVGRHESLRTSFAVLAGEPIQVVGPAGLCELPCIDLCALPSGPRETEVTRLAADEAAQPFDLTRGPLLRLRLLVTGGGEHVLLLALHHIIGDGWSMGLLVEEFAELYRARLEGRPMALPELPLQYADFAQWQRQWLTGDGLEAEIAYWRQQLGGRLQAAELPADHQRPAARFHRGAQRAWSIPSELAAGLKALCRREGVTLFMSLLASFDVLLCHYTGNHDIVVGTDVANRGHSGTERLMGFFVNQLVLRTDLSGNPAFCEILRRVRRVTLEGYTHQHLPFERLVERLQPDRDPQRPPFFQVKLVLQHDPGALLELPGLTVQGLGRELRGTAELDFILNLNVGAQNLTGVAYYSADLFDPATIDRFLDQLELVLQNVVASPAARLDELLEVLREDDDQRQSRLRKAVAPQNLIKMRGARRRALEIAPAVPDGGGAVTHGEAER